MQLTPVSFAAYHRVTVQGNNPQFFKLSKSERNDGFQDGNINRRTCSRLESVARRTLQEHLDHIGAEGFTPGLYDALDWAHLNHPCPPSQRTADVVFTTKPPRPRVRRGQFSDFDLALMENYQKYARKHPDLPLQHDVRLTTKDKWQSADTVLAQYAAHKVNHTA